ncbi:hypothetical protein HYE82_09140 [Streptomyces sp. BR123]|uniref:hypothetical protein n=1 Tax=Streptomyces sp. BR123 TaxID=2749828 RepID=UPI0015C43A7D|nr:hypothetical protein [Streptomyces sp. BR123]NXY94555.1 hypothetical protein [Streptomyces sp. BR123]
MEHEQTPSELRKEQEAGPEPDAPARPGTVAALGARRRGRRTALLTAGAAALGILAGTVTGYAVQYGRPPTPLPPLAQQKIDQPKPQAPNESTSARALNAHRWHKTDDDLTKLLLEAPGGVQVLDSGTESADEFAADYYVKPNAGLEHQIRYDLRRIAMIRWSQDDRNHVTVRLLQYRDRAGADWYQHAHDYLSEKRFAGNPGKDLAGVPADFGHVWVDSEAKQEPGYHPTRSARVLARRGDIVMELDYANTRGVIDENDVVELARRQWERL